MIVESYHGTSGGATEGQSRSRTSLVRGPTE